MTVTGPGYWFTEIEYHHPYDAPDAESVAVTAWFTPFGRRTLGHIRVGEVEA